MITDLFEEIYVSMSRNKLRIALTGFSIAWGIFLLIVLLGAGNGLLHGMMANFASQSVNKVNLWPGRTSVEKDGLPKGREIYFDLRDVEYMRRQFPKEVASIQPKMEFSCHISMGPKHISGTLAGVYPETLTHEGSTIVLGRGINEIDIREQRKVMVMHEKNAEKLFDEASQALDQWVRVDDLLFHVVGIYTAKNANRDDDTFAPISTVTGLYGPDGHYTSLALFVQNLDTKEANEDFNQALRATMARHKQFSENDRRAMWIWNSYEDYLQAKNILDGIQLLIWIIGIATLIAGVTGISNIMLITVRERTHEFGIRKAIGARPSEIVRLVMCESVAITMVFGYAGMFVGLGLTELVGKVLSMGGNTGEESFSVFKDPTVDLPIVIAATVVMVIAGVIAGYVPAKRAVDIKPIEALTL